MGAGLKNSPCAHVCWHAAAADGPSGLHRYKLRLLFDAVEMRWDWPVDVNYHEAQVGGRKGSRVLVTGT